jgi:hypothetical protein
MLRSESVVGVNFEAGKIIEHVRSTPRCVAYANCQISMDAPFSDRVADDTVRNTGRSELLFVKNGYEEHKLIAKFKEILQLLKTTYLDPNPHIKMVIQIARGKAAISTRREIIEPVLDELGIHQYDIVTGYRTADYYNGLRGTESFVFVNYGMFGVFTGVDTIGVGEICNPITTWSLTQERIDPETGKIITQKVDGSELSFGSDPRNVLNKDTLGTFLCYVMLSDLI